MKPKRVRAVKTAYAFFNGDSLIERSGTGALEIYYSREDAEPHRASIERGFDRTADPKIELNEIEIRIKRAGITAGRKHK